MSPERGDGRSRPSDEVTPRLLPTRVRRCGTIASDAMSKRTKTGTFLGVPYDWRRPTIARAKSRRWNPQDPRLFTPKTYGWGWDVNLARLFGRKP